MIEHGIISSFSKCLTYFKTYDRVLGNVYKYSGLTYNFELARDILVGLDNIINLGEMIIENTNNTNPFAMHFDSECVDQLRWLLSTIKENPHQEEINAWRQVLKYFCLFLKQIFFLTRKDQVTLDLKREFSLFCLKFREFGLGLLIINLDMFYQ